MISRRPATRSEEGLELLSSTKTRLGIDGDRSWIVPTEANVFAWPGPDLRPVEGQGSESIAYGMLPPKFMATLKDRFLEGTRRRRAGVVKRT